MTEIDGVWQRALCGMCGRWVDRATLRKMYVDSQRLDTTKPVDGSIVQPANNLCTATFGGSEHYDPLVLTYTGAISFGPRHDAVVVADAANNWILQNGAPTFSGPGYIWWGPFNLSAVTYFSFSCKFGQYQEDTCLPYFSEVQAGTCAGDPTSKEYHPEKTFTNITGDNWRIYFSTSESYTIDRTKVYFYLYVNHSSATAQWWVSEIQVINGVIDPQQFVTHVDYSPVSSANNGAVRQIINVCPDCRDERLKIDRRPVKREGPINPIEELLIRNEEY